jgi:monovalent cation/hydrogen antiporter
MPNGSVVQSVEALFLLLLVFVAFFAGIARRLNIPYPILLVIAGLIVSLLPGMPRINLNPDMIFLVFLPPLLYAAAWALYWREFQNNFPTIAKLALNAVTWT